MNPQAICRIHPASPLRTEGVDFLGSVFPEHAFPPVMGTGDDFRAACRRGYAAMGESRVAIAGLARNVGGVLPLTIRRIEDLGRWFADYRVFVYENDSSDDTRPLLGSWTRSNPRVHVTCEDLRDPVNPTTRCIARAERMAFYRHRCQQDVLARCGRFDFTILIDLDILGGWSIDGIANSFGHHGWDFVGSNGLIYRRDGLAMNALRQYDTWALRFDGDLTPLSTSAAGGLVYGRGTPLVPVTSCFGGLGIYTMDAYGAGRYATDDLEHATFHRELIARGRSRLFLNPSQILVYGRRRRFGDRTVVRLLDAWAAVSGRRERTLFPPGGRPHGVDRAADEVAIRAAA
ncbi:MAG: hypothetical protein K8S94_13855 [Planctomycetia bacterium]|nr:hypothetical protein [Planctomycetia bacterium]